MAPKMLEASVDGSKRHMIAFLKVKLNVQEIMLVE